LNLAIFVEPLAMVIQSAARVWLPSLGLILASAVAWLRCRAAKGGEDITTPDCSIAAVLCGTWSLGHWLARKSCAISLRLFLSVCSTAIPLTSPDATATDMHWTSLHIAATEGHASVAKVLVQSGCSVNAATRQGHTALAIAVARGHVDVVKVLLDAKADLTCKDERKMTALHVAAARADPHAASLLVAFGAPLEAMDAGGYTPLLIACTKEQRWTVAELLLKSGAEHGVATHGQRLSPTLLVAEWADEQASAQAVKTLLDCQADASACDVFGSTALHVACRAGRAALVEALCRGGAPPAAQDNDGHFPLELLCSCCARSPEDDTLVEVAMMAILAADPAAASRLDFSDASALHVLLNLAGVEKTRPLQAVRCLLDGKADPTTEDESGWTAAHYAAHAGKTEDDRESLLQALRMGSTKQSDFWESLDLEKPRNTSNTKYLARRGGHHRIPLEVRNAVLDGDMTLSGVARLIAQGRCQKIVALVGAGASTAAGIPDFRSASGLWARKSTRELFSYEGFFAEPERFWRSMAELFVDRSPTKVHALLALMEKKGILVRVYTQNIDGLEHAAGVSAERIVECHGTVSRVVCSANAGHATQGLTAASVARRVASGEAALRCHCGALLRPDIVFFGEPLPATFHQLSGQDLADCDLLLVIGTALSVYPVAGLVSRVSMTTPRLLLNREPVGPWRHAQENPENYRDVFFGGDCEEGAQMMAKDLSWSLS